MSVSLVADMRSDTITRPSFEMRQAMASAEVGDDVLGEDPTVSTLEREVAAYLGKEAALFVPSGVMANQIAIHCHTRPGDEVVAAENSHVNYYESGAPALLSGVMMRLINVETGVFTEKQLADIVRPTNIHFPRCSLVCIENTTNLGGGKAWPLDTVAAVSAWAHSHCLKLHMDGARIWNASIATGVPEKHYAALCDSVSGLGAPIGSCLTGTKDFIDQARRFRKLLGGGMRQSGIVAAGALYAFHHNRERLAEDHALAKKFGRGLATIPGIFVDVSAIETNILYFSLTTKKITTYELIDKLKARGVLLNAVADGIRIRAVVSYEVTSAALDKALEIIAEVMKS